jgi:DNA-binding SARP family transcriptional activator
MHPMTNEICSLRLHGYPAVELNGRAAPLPLKHGLALLAYLADHTHRVGRDTLAALLWPDAAPGVARSRLRRLVHAMHERTGCVLAHADHDALWLAPGVGSDLQHTEAALAQAEGALARAQRGDTPALHALAPLLRTDAASVLAGFVLGSDAFDDWLEQRRRVQHTRVVHALERTTEHALAAHDSALAQAAAVALLRLEPCAEIGHVARIDARAQRGDAAGVDAAYFDCADRLRREFGRRPSARIEAAYACAQSRLQPRTTADSSPSPMPWMQPRTMHDAARRLAA